MLPPKLLIHESTGWVPGWFGLNKQLLSSNLYSELHVIFPNIFPQIGNKGTGR